MKTPVSHAGFTLAEVLTALGIFGLVMAAALPFFLQLSTVMFVSESKLSINRDIRAFTSEMADHARDANSFFIYSSFLADDRDTAADRVRDGEPGDLLVLLYLDAPAAWNAPRPINRMVGYYRAASDPLNPASEGPVRKFDLSFSPASTEDAEDLLPVAASINLHPEVVELSRGLANDKLFYNFLDRSVMVKGELIHGNETRRVTDTYNFTISPRG